MEGSSKIVEWRIKMTNTKKLQCPFCGSEEGYYIMEVVHRGLFFTFDDKPCGSSEDMTDWEGKRKYCTNCHKILPKKLFEK